MRPRSQSSRSSTSQLSPPQISLTCLGSRGRGTQWAASGKNPPLSEYIAHLYPSGQSWAHMLQSSPGPGPHAGSEQVSFVVVDEGESVSPCVVVVVVAGEDVPTESLVAVADAAVADSTPASLPAHDQTTATLMRTNHRCCFETRDREVLHLSILGSLPDQLDAQVGYGPGRRGLISLVSSVGETGEARGISSVVRNRETKLGSAVELPVRAPRIDSAPARGGGWTAEHR